MPGITLAQAEARLADWLAADERVASGQSYSIGSRTLTRTDAAEIRKNIDYWEGKVNDLSRGTGGGIRSRLGTPT